MDTHHSYMMALDIGGTKTDAALIEGTQIITRLQVPTERGFPGIFNSAKHALLAVEAQSGISRKQVIGIGVGIAGQVENEAVKYAVNLNIEGTPAPIGPELRQEFNLPVQVENDLTTATVGALLNRQSPESAVFISIGTGLAAGVMTDGKFLRGHQHMAGEIGHLVRDPNGPQCKCGQFGCFEMYVSGSALERRWAQVRPDASTRDTTTPAATEIFTAAAQNDPQALRIREDFIVALAELIHLVGLTTDPEYILIGGGLSSLGSALSEPLILALKQAESTSPFLAQVRLSSRVELVPPHLGTALLGAAHLTKRSILETERNSR